jgi:hypothetical protein
MGLMARLMQSIGTAVVLTLVATASPASADDGDGLRLEELAFAQNYVDATTIDRVPNTTPPTASNVAVSPSTVPQSQAYGVRVTMQVHAPIAPVNRSELMLDDANGDQVYLLSGPGPSWSTVLEIPLHLWEFPTGVYTIGFTLTDTSGLSTSYGTPNGHPMPGGPLNLTITEG